MTKLEVIGVQIGSGHPYYILEEDIQEAREILLKLEQKAIQADRQYKRYEQNFPLNDPRD